MVQSIISRGGWAAPAATAIALLLCGAEGAAASACRIDPTEPAGDALGREVAVPEHLRDGDEFQIPLTDLLAHGAKLFDAVWTIQEGGGRPLTKGTGAPLADPGDPLLFPRNFNRISAPDANACGGCHNKPSAGGGGDIVTNVFVLGQRFDFASFDPLDDHLPTKGSVDERGDVVTLSTIANARATLGMHGSGFIEMLARQMTVRLQAQRDQLRCGQSVRLQADGVHFGALARRPQAEGCGFDTSAVEGLPQSSLAAGPDGKPSLVLRPFHQAGAVVSLREFTNNAFNHHHGIQAVERFGEDADPDGDQVCNELTRADVTATSVWQATLPVPGRVIPTGDRKKNAVLLGEALFDRVGCTECHRLRQRLEAANRVFSEPNPFNPPGNLQRGEAPVFEVDLTSADLPGPRPEVRSGVVEFAAYTDLKLHDITTGAPDDPDREPLDMVEPAGTSGFFDGNSRFLTRKLWGSANEPPYFHHGKFTTLRQAIGAHFGEAETARAGFDRLNRCEQGSLIEFLMTLQVLPEGAAALTVDSAGSPLVWPPHDRGTRLAAARQACAG